MYVVVLLNNDINPKKFDPVVFGPYETYGLAHEAMERVKANAEALDLDVREIVSEKSFMEEC